MSSERKSEREQGGSHRESRGETGTGVATTRGPLFVTSSRRFSSEPEY